MTPECHCGSGDPGGERVGARGERAAVARGNEGPASVATRNPYTLPPAQGGQSESVERPPGFNRDSEPPSSSPERGSREEGPGTRRKLTSPGQHSGASGVETSCATVCKLSGRCRFPRAKGEQCRRGAGGAEGWRGGARAGAQLEERAGAGARAAGPNSPPTRLGGGARLRVCNARAPRRLCVPAFPFLPRRSSGQTEPRAAAKAPAAPSGSTAGRALAAARSGSGTGGRGPRSRAPPGSGAGPGAVSEARRPSGLRGGGRGSGRLQAPPAGRPGSSPFLSTPSLHPRTPCRESRRVCSRGGGNLRCSRTGRPSRCSGTRRSVPPPRA